MSLAAILYGVFASAVFLCGAWIMILNYYGWLYLGLVRKEHHSPIPLLGGLFCFAVLRSRDVAVHFWAWLPVILDPGCVFLVGVFIYAAMVTRGFQRVCLRKPGTE